MQPKALWKMKHESDHGVGLQGRLYRKKRDRKFQSNSESGDWGESDAPTSVFGGLGIKRSKGQAGAVKGLHVI